MHNYTKFEIYNNLTYKGKYNMILLPSNTDF